MDNKNQVIEYERALLGCLLINKEVVNKIKGLLNLNDFYDKKNQIVFQAIDEIMDRGFTIEPIPVINIIKENNNLENIGGEIYIDFLISEAGLESNITKYIENIIEKSKLRQVLKEISSIQEIIKKKNITSDEILERVEMDIISNTRNNVMLEFKPIKTIVEEAVHDLSLKLSGELISGIPSEFEDLDKITGGFHKGDLIIIAARPSMGKTALALNIASNVARKKNVAFFSIEMSNKQLINRIIGFNGFLSSWKIQKPEYMTTSDKQKFTVASKKVSKLKLFLDDSPGIKLSELLWKAKRLKKNKGLDMIVIDYLQLITTGVNSDNRQNEVSTISRNLKKLARELEIPIIALSQLSRKVEQRESKIPMMSDIRESGAIEQDADLIAFVYRESYYANKDAKENNKPQETKIIIGKHRNGATGIINLSFNPEYGLFLDAIKENSDNEF